MNRWKKISHSLLAILMAVALVVSGIIAVLIFGVAEQSVSNFENFIIDSRLQETAAAADSFSQDVEALNTLLFNEMTDNTLVRLQHYLDSGMYSYTYLEQVSIVQKQLLAIKNAMPLSRNVEIYLPDTQRVITSSSLMRYEREDAPWLDAMFADPLNRLYIADEGLLIYSARQAGDLLFRRSVAVVNTITQDTMRQYLRKFASSGVDTSISVFVQQQQQVQLFADSGNHSPDFAEHVGRIIASRPGGSEQFTFDFQPYLLTWASTTLEPVKMCQITPMSIVTDQLQVYQKRISLVLSVTIVLMISLVLFLYIMTCYPIRRMKTALARVEEGDLSVRISPTWSDEFQQIFGQFNQMTEKLQNLIDQEYKLKLLNVNAELKQMRYQISPHFLYNAYFNMRAMLWDEEYDAAAEMAELMGRYLRYITASATDEATLKEEMEHSIAYMDIQKLRFGDKLETRVKEYPAWANNMIIPRIIIQPLIENSFVHGIKNVDGLGIITVEVVAQGDNLTIIVEDNGPNATDEMIAEVQHRLESGERDPDSDSVALLNIQRRIRLLYPEGSGLYVSRSSMGGFRSEIRMTGAKRNVSDADR